MLVDTKLANSVAADECQRLLETFSVPAAVLAYEMVQTLPMEMKCLSNYLPMIEMTLEKAFDETPKNLRSNFELLVKRLL